MAYIGRPLNAGNLAVQSGTGDGSDTTPIATLDYSVGSSNSIGVYLDGVRQLAGTDFTASGTVLTFTTAPANGVGVDVYFLGLELSIPTPADDTVTGAKIVDDAIDSEHYTDGSIDTAHIAVNQIDETLMKDAFVADFGEVTVAAGDSILLGDVSGSGATKRDTVQGILDLVPAAGITLGTVVASTSGATIDFTGIPSGTKRILVNIDKISTNGASHPMLQIGDGGGFETSGYNGCIAWTQAVNVVSSTVFTTGFGVFGPWGSSTIGSGTTILSLLDPATYTWVASSSHGRNAVVGNWHGGGGKSLSAELTQVRFTMVNGSDTFDAGKINISYE